MIEALLAAVRDGLRSDLGYDRYTCDIMASGKPPPAMGDYFAAVHGGESRCDSINSKDEYFGFVVTLTMRVTVPVDRVALVLTPQEIARKIGWYRRVREISSYLHQCWGLLGAANTILVEATTDREEVYGFCEPPHFSSASEPALVGGEWFAAGEESAATDCGVMGDLHFDGARRLQPIGFFG